LKESSLEDGATPKKDDISKLMNCFKTMWKCINNAIRCEKRGERLRITVAEKIPVLGTCSSYAKRNNQEYITPDMTPQEQELNKKLRLDVK